MKKLLKLSVILSWVNLIAGSLLTLGGLISMLFVSSIINVLLSVILPGAVILHSYATLQLRKNILNPNISINRQTSTGIRLMGFMALFFAMMNTNNAIIILQNVQAAAKQIKLPVQAKDMNVAAVLRATSIFTLVISASILANVVLSFRLLKWYLFYKNNETK
jgi:hypothetical protein